VPQTLSSHPFTWVGDTPTLAKFLSDHHSNVYAIDTEFSSGRTYDSVLALVQLSIDGFIALIDPFTVDLRALSPLFASTAVAVFHAADQDLDLLERAVGTRPSRLFDTQVAASLLGQATPSLALVARRLGVTLDKSQRLTDWTVRPLKPATLHYAAADVAYLPALYVLLDAELRSAGRRTWLDEEMAALLARPLTSRVPKEAWWRIPGALVSSAAHQALYQSVAEARDEVARSCDKPPSHVASDQTLVALVRACPAPTEVLSRLSQVEALTPSTKAALIEATNHLPTELVRPVGPSPSPAQDRLATVLAAYAQQCAHDLSIGRDLLSSKPDLLAYLTGQPSRLNTSWRRALLTNDIDKLRSGTAALTLTGDRFEVVPTT
jgi:ribonuclease D